jgi:hypothetical protein
MTDSILMTCGHRSQATSDGKPVCAICIGTSADTAARTVRQPPDLTGRKAHCIQCNRETDSSVDLPFFALGGDRRTAPLELRDRWHAAWTVVILAGGRSQADPLLVASMDDLLRQVVEAATGDLYYCGCRGWD